MQVGAASRAGHVPVPDKDIADLMASPSAGMQHGTVAICSPVWISVGRGHDGGAAAYANARLLLFLSNLTQTCWRETSNAEYVRTVGAATASGCAGCVASVTAKAQSQIVEFPAVWPLLPRSGNTHCQLQGRDSTTTGRLRRLPECVGNTVSGSAYQEILPGRRACP